MIENSPFEDLELNPRLVWTL